MNFERLFWAGIVLGACVIVVVVVFFEVVNHAG